MWFKPPLGEVSKSPVQSRVVPKCNRLDAFHVQPFELLYFHV